VATTIRPRAFVVMPFGVKEARAAVEAKGGEPAQPAVHVDFDLVYEHLIAPALTRAGCAPFRADEEEAAGDIRTDMFYELVTADVVVADVSSSNGNVFYELGVRHAVGPGGVFMIHGGWAKRIFDLAPDRTFAYDGKAFVAGKNERDEAWKAAVAAEAERLGGVLAAALDADARTIGSPVYKEMPGLKAVDWSGVRTARSKYFGDVFADWRQRVDVAKENGWPGDILTLADEAPTLFHHKKLLWHAADALCSMERYEAALPVLQQLVRLDPDHRDAQTRLGLVLGRSGRVAEAKVHMLAMVEKFQHDTEAHGILGRVFKDLWRLEWKDAPTLEERQQGAVAASSFIASAVKSYDAAARRKFDYYNGVNVVSFVRLLEHLQKATGDLAADHGVEDVDTLTSVVHFAATNTLASAGLTIGQDGVWAAASLGELALGAGNGAVAAKLYRDAANAPATTYFNVGSMLAQIELFDELGFQPAAVAAVRKVLTTRRAALEKRIGGLKASAPRFGKVAVCSGHMIDAPDRDQERFPPRKEGAVRQRMAAKLDEWAIGAGDLAICGAARGADLLFAELCAERGAEVWLLQPLPEGEFLEESVCLPEGDWEERYFRMRERPGTKLLLQQDRLKPPPKSSSEKGLVFARNNLWMLNTARVEAPDTDKLYALLVWDRKPTGDGPGGTSDFVKRVKSLGGRRGYVNPLELE
jgi:tetratricopeptide (TPR) repeat protein